MASVGSSPDLHSEKAPTEDIAPPSPPVSWSVMGYAWSRERAARDGLLGYLRGSEDQTSIATKVF